MACHLVAIYSDVHGTVIDLDPDVYLRNAVEATGRTYLAITDPFGPLTATPIPGKAALIVVRWPRPTKPGLGRDTKRLFNRCKQHLEDDGSTIVVVSAARPRADGPTYVDYERVLLPDAEQAGLRHLQDIVPLDATDGRDAFTYATPRRTAELTADSDFGTRRHVAVTTLVIYGHPGRWS